MCQSKSTLHDIKLCQQFCRIGNFAKLNKKTVYFHQVSAIVKRTEMWEIRMQQVSYSNKWTINPFTADPVKALQFAILV